MKSPILILLFILLTMVSCQKELIVDRGDNNYMKNIQAALKDSMDAINYAALDFSKVVRTYIDSGQIHLTRIGFKEQKIANDFLLLQTNEKGNCLRGRVVSIYGALNDKGQYNGSVTIKNLQGKVLTRSAIINGFITSFHRGTSRKAVEPDPYIELPEVVIISSYRAESISWSEWYSLTSFLAGSGGGGGGGYYSQSDPGGSAGSNGSYGGSGGSGGHNVPSNTIYIGFEGQYDDAAINVEKFMKCFTAIPDAGSTGSIELFTDIPVNGDPSKFFDWSNGSPGHVFIQLRKQNGTQSVTQNIGFYPVSGWKTTTTPAPINGKFVDNHHHEFNASIKIKLSAAQVQTAVTRILYLSRFVRYDIDDYNCTDWALNVFNETVKVEEQIKHIQRYNIPGGMAPNGTSTPQGLYLKLQQMKRLGGAPASNINIPLVGWVGASKGPCN